MSLWSRFKAWRERRAREKYERFLASPASITTTGSSYAPNVCEKCGWMHPLGVRECKSTWTLGDSEGNLLATSEDNPYPWRVVWNMPQDWATGVAKQEDDWPEVLDD